MTDAYLQTSAESDSTDIKLMQSAAWLLIQIQQASDYNMHEKTVEAGWFQYLCAYPDVNPTGNQFISCLYMLV